MPDQVRVSPATPVLTVVNVGGFFMEVFSVSHRCSCIRGEKARDALRLQLDNGRMILLKKTNE